MIINISSTVNLHELSQQYGVDKYNFFVSEVDDKIMILYGETPEDGVEGLGATSEEAINDFAEHWKSKYNKVA